MRGAFGGISTTLGEETRSGVAWGGAGMNGDGSRDEGACGGGSVKKHLILISCASSRGQRVHEPS